MPRVDVAPFAWSGWRLALPGNPPGGQYHGFTANDGLNGIDGAMVLEGIDGLASSAGPWETEWGGIALQEGDELSDYVHRTSAEMRPRANASGGTNVITEFQVQRPGPLAPGHLPVMIGRAPQGDFYDRIELPLPPRFAPRTVATVPKPRVVGTPVKAKPPAAHIPVPVRKPLPKVGPTGWTHTTTQPPPPKSPAPAPTVANRCAAGEYIDAAGNCTADWHNPYSLYLPKSPAPAPTVAASPSDFLPSNGQPLDASAAAAAGASWFDEETIIPGVKNSIVAGGSALLAILLLRGKR
jgi:hypothetical protein